MQIKLTPCSQLQAIQVNSGASLISPTALTYSPIFSSADLIITKTLQLILFLRLITSIQYFLFILVANKHYHKAQHYRIKQNRTAIKNIIKSILFIEQAREHTFCWWKHYLVGDECESVQRRLNDNPQWVNCLVDSFVINRLMFEPAEVQTK